MEIKALVSFSGAFSMHVGQVRECSKGATLKDLLQAGYVEEVKPEVSAEILEKELRKKIEEELAIEKIKGENPLAKDADADGSK